MLRASRTGAIASFRAVDCEAGPPGAGSALLVASLQPCWLEPCPHLQGWHVKVAPWPQDWHLSSSSGEAEQGGCPAGWLMGPPERVAEGLHFLRAGGLTYVSGRVTGFHSRWVISPYPVQHGTRTDLDLNFNSLVSCVLLGRSFREPFCTFLHLSCPRKQGNSSTVQGCDSAGGWRRPVAPGSEWAGALLSSPSYSCCHPRGLDEQGGTIPRSCRPPRVPPAPSPPAPAARQPYSWLWVPGEP